MVDFFAGDAERGEPPLVPDPMGVVFRREHDAGRIHALRQVPEPLAADAPGDRDLAAHHQELQHLGDVAVVGPPGRGPRNHARVRDVARAQRPGAGEQLEDVAAETVVVADPRVRALVTATRPAGDEVQADVAHRPHERVVLEQRAILLQCPFAGRRAGRPSRGGSRRRGRRSAQRPRWGRSAAASAAGRLSTRSVGRGESSNCARTAMRRACGLVSRCTHGG